MASVVSDTSEETTTKAKEALKKIFKINVKWAHEYLGHLSKDTTGLIAKYLGMNLLRGTLPVCKLCAIAKAKQKNLPKETSGANKATEFNGQVFYDLSKIKVKEYAQAEGVSAGFGVDSESVSDLSCGIGVSEMVECWENVQRTSARCWAK